MAVRLATAHVALRRLALGITDFDKLAGRRAGATGTRDLVVTTMRAEERQRSHAKKEEADKDVEEAVGEEV